MDRLEVKKLLANMADDYNTEIDERMLDTWCRHLIDKDSDKVKVAYNQYFDTDQKGKAPTISQLCSILKTIAPEKTIFKTERPELHWNKFGELEDANGYVYVDPSWTEEDYARNKLLYHEWQSAMDVPFREIEETRQLEVNEEEVR